MKKLFRLFIFAVLLLTLSSTSLILPATASAATVKLNKTKLTLDEGKFYTLKISGTTKAVKWTSSSKSVATVSTKGKVTAVAKGSATITATVSSKKYTCKVTVKEVFNESKAAKDIDSELEDIGSGVIAILENNYSFSFSLSASMVFYDENGSMIGESSDNNYYFEKGKKMCNVFSRSS